MPRQIRRRIRRLIASLGVVGASVFTVVPTDGCYGALDIILEDVTCAISDPDGCIPTGDWL
jgi:hypothetical protein